MVTMSYRAKTTCLAWVTFALTTFWVILMIVGIAGAGPLGQWSDILRHVTRLVTQRSVMHYLTYLNATLLTLVNTWLFVLLLRKTPLKTLTRRRVALFVLYIYGALNALCYASQITLVPWIVAQGAQSQQVVQVEAWLRATIQLWPDSLVALLNALAYALLGWPALLVGRWLWSRGKSGRVAGAMLILNSVACWIGLAGFILKAPLLANGVTLGGVFYWLALLALGFTLGHGKLRSANPSEE